MKTAISIPDEIFEEAERLAKHVKRSRSEVYSRALAEYVRARTGRRIRHALRARVLFWRGECPAAGVVPPWPRLSLRVRRQRQPLKPRPRRDRDPARSLAVRRLSARPAKPRADVARGRSRIALVVRLTARRGLQSTARRRVSRTRAEDH